MTEPGFFHTIKGGVGQDSTHHCQPLAECLVVTIPAITISSSGETSQKGCPGDVQLVAVANITISSIGETSQKVLARSARDGQDPQSLSPLAGRLRRRWSIFAGIFGRKAITISSSGETSQKLREGPEQAGLIATVTISSTGGCRHYLRYLGDFAEATRPEVTNDCAGASLSPYRGDFAEGGGFSATYFVVKRLLSPLLGDFAEASTSYAALRCWPIYYFLKGNFAEGASGCGQEKS